MDNDDTDGAANDPRNQTIPGYELVNLFATYTPKQVPNLSLRLGIDNVLVLNQTYASRANYGAGRSTILPINEPGRTFSVLATLDF